MIHVQLTKIASLPDRPDGTGAAGSITAGYVIKGYYLSLAIGEPLTVIRYERNGEKVGGIFTTSPVKVFYGDPEGITVKTENSEYRLDFLPQLGEDTEQQIFPT